MNVLPVIVQLAIADYRKTGGQHPTHLFLGERQWQELKVLAECTPCHYMGLAVVLTDQENLICVTGAVIKEHVIQL